MEYIPFATPFNNYISTSFSVSLRHYHILTERQQPLLSALVFHIWHAFRYKHIPLTSLKVLKKYPGRKAILKTEQKN